MLFIQERKIDVTTLELRYSVSQNIPLGRTKKQGVGQDSFNIYNERLIYRIYIGIPTNE